MCTEDISALCEQNIEFFIVKPSGTKVTTRLPAPAALQPNLGLGRLQASLFSASLFQFLHCNILVSLSIVSNHLPSSSGPSRWYLLDFKWLIIV